MISDTNHSFHYFRLLLILILVWIVVLERLQTLESFIYLVLQFSTMNSLMLLSLHHQSLLWLYFTSKGAYWLRKIFLINEVKNCWCKNYNHSDPLHNSYRVIEPQNAYYDWKYFSDSYNKRNNMLPELLDQIINEKLDYCTHWSIQ